MAPQLLPVALAWFASLAAAQSYVSIAGSSGVVPPNATSTGGAAAFTTSLAFSLDDFWREYIGPVEVADVTTTVQATPIPSAALVPPPPLFYGQAYGDATPDQSSLYGRNASWKFPKNFWWGIASASYQVEGAAKDEGRGPSIWDKFTRIPGYTVANQTGDIANNHYYLYRQDIARLAAIGVPAYSFSISWSRIFPFGSGQINEQALAHYDDVVDACIEMGIEPIITLYHWDLPLFLQEKYGGWLSEEIVDDFAEYARVVFMRYRSKVHRWTTFNEPIVFCGTYPQPVGYFKSTPIPGKQQPFYCGQSVLLAHAKAYHIGKSLMPNSTIFLKNNGGYKIPLTNSSDNAIATQRAWDFNEGWFWNPLFINGDYPRYLKEYVSTFLRPFTAAEKMSMKGSSDILAHDAYTASFYSAPDIGIEACMADNTFSLFPSCANTTNQYPEELGGWNVGFAADPTATWLHKATDWVPQFLRYMQETWKPAGGIAVTEFGFAEPFEGQKTMLSDIRFDYSRTMYYHDYMQAILIALADGVNVVGALAWSFIDNLEWQQGYTSKFGMQYCNFTSQERHFKASFFEYVAAFDAYKER
ncbi:glycoside hydrolase family 1 protein [Aulographum hederae CBS 113979]|uniref:Glycoside hydrolase family 1 protein n=1 Tax=Aulographum hederae CBS 113979 TaxID=1176131 RepID=A0A6G1GSK1_9PEZI|nr:glycoside hydrolase family 1 protein [Aulographum hederae CBS 113979]